MKKVLLIYTFGLISVFISGQNIFPPSGNTGIGTTSPFSDLHITSPLNPQIQLRSQATGLRGLWITTDDSNGIISLNSSYNNSGAYPIVFQMGNQEKLRITNQGFIGIGYASPDAKLHVYGEEAGQGNVLASIMIGKNNGPEIQAIQESADDDVQSLAFRVKSSSTNADDNFEALRIYKNGNIGFGISSPKGKLEIYNSATFNTDMTAVAQDHILLSAPDPGNGNYFGSITWQSGGRRRASIVATREHDDKDYVGIAFFTKGTDGSGPIYESMRITRNGNVLIGKTSQQNSSYKLDVAGSIRANEVKVNLDGADFVFEPDYKLKPLDEVETFVKENKHLPDIEPAVEMKTEGTNLGEMNTKLLQKIEELTLYVIDINKEVEKLKNENELLKEKLSIEE